MIRCLAPLLSIAFSTLCFGAPPAWNLDQPTTRTWFALLEDGDEPTMVIEMEGLAYAPAITGGDIAESVREMRLEEVRQRPETVVVRKFDLLAKRDLAGILELCLDEEARDYYRGVFRNIDHSADFHEQEVESVLFTSKCRFGSRCLIGYSYLFRSGGYGPWGEALQQVGDAYFLAAPARFHPAFISISSSFPTQHGYRVLASPPLGDYRQILFIPEVEPQPNAPLAPIRVYCQITDLTDDRPLDRTLRSQKVIYQEMLNRMAAAYRNAARAKASGEGAPEAYKHLAAFFDPGMQAKLGSALTLDPAEFTAQLRLDDPAASVFLNGDAFEVVGMVRGRQSDYVLARPSGSTGNTEIFVTEFMGENKQSVAIRPEQPAASEILASEEFRAAFAAE